MNIISSDEIASFLEKNGLVFTSTEQPFHKALAIIKYDNFYLLCKPKEKSDTKSGLAKFGLPGGHRYFKVDINTEWLDSRGRLDQFADSKYKEPAEVSAIREAIEEAGIKLGDIKFVSPATVAPYVSISKGTPEKALVTVIELKEKITLLEIDENDVAWIDLNSFSQTQEIREDHLQIIKGMAFYKSY